MQAMQWLVNQMIIVSAVVMSSMSDMIALKTF